MGNFDTTARLTPQVGQRIRESRVRQRMTQFDLARKIGCSYQVVQRYERGERLSVDRLLLLAALLHEKPEWLLTGVRPRPPLQPKILSSTVLSAGKPRKSFRLSY